MTGHVVVATGTKREATALRGSGWTVIAGGGDPEGLRARLEAAAGGASGLLSFGMAGALADDLTIGDWVVGTAVVGAVSQRCDPAWCDGFVAALRHAHRGRVYADGRMITDVVEKRALGRRFGALAVDMESHVAASVASERGLRLAVLRCVSDEASRPLPSAIAVAMRPDGALDMSAMLRTVARRPGQLPDLARTLFGFARAMRSLEQGGEAIRRVG